MAEEFQYQWTDNPTVSGVAKCDTDVLNDCLMHLKYDKKDGGTGLQLFDTILKDHVLTYEESKGLELQGTYVYKDAVAGSRYGYPDFYAKCLEEYNEATATETVNGVTVKVHSNGHKFYDIANKSAIDGFFNTMGTAWFYGVDTANERIFLPRDNYFALKGVAPVAGNGMTLGLTEGINNFTLTVNNGNAQDNKYLYCTGSFGSSVGTNAGDVTGNTNITGDDLAIGVTTDATKSGIEAHLQSNENKYLYICVGNTVSDTSWVDIVTQVEGGVKDLEDKKNTSIAEIDANAKSYDNLTYRQITNCLLEVPQNIKLELNNGVLTLKAGSKVIIPNGFESDGITPKFDYVTVESDLTVVPLEEGLLIMNGSTNAIGVVKAHYSGASQPTLTGSGEGALWYNTAENKMYRYDGSNWESSTLRSLPVGKITTTSIDQVFNGMGYIGSTIWVDKGIKVLIPNGRNTDGTLKNIEVVTDKVQVVACQYTNGLDLGIKADGTFVANTFNSNQGTYFVDMLAEKPAVSGSYGWCFSNQDNRWYRNQGTTTWQEFPITYIGRGFCDSNLKITSTQFKQPFRAIDHSELEEVQVVVETYSNGASGYRIWSDGYCEQWGLATSLTTNSANTITLLKSYLNTNYQVIANGYAKTATTTGGVDVFHSAPLTVSSFNLTRDYASNDQVAQANWRAFGYIS